MRDRGSSKALLAVLLLLSLSGLAGTQTRQPVSFSTPPQTITLTIRSKGAQPRELVALVTYSLTSALPDDTLRGTLRISFVSVPNKNKPPVPLSAESLQGLPQSISKEEVPAGFLEQTACPKLKLQIGEVELEDSIVIGGFVIVVPEKRDDEVSQLLCFWTTQINSNRVRKGIVGKINDLIRTEIDPDSATISGHDLISKPARVEH